MNRDFKGIWIPREIWLHKELKPLEILLWAEIHSLFDRESGGCYASNDYLANFFKISERYIREMISHLTELGFIEQVSFDGRTRTIRAVLPPEDFSPPESSSGQTGTTVPGREEPQFRSGRSHSSSPSYIERKAKRKEYKKKQEANASVSADAETLCVYFLEEMKKRLPSFEIKNKNVWLKDCDAMLRIDKRPIEECKRLIFFAQQHQFWKKNIMSPGKLREKFQELQLIAQAEDENDLIRANREYALKLKEKYPEKLKGMSFDASFVTNIKEAREISLKMRHEEFKAAIVSLFGGRS